VAVAGPDLDDEFDKDEFVEEFGADEKSAPWHNSTPAVVGASVLGIAVIGILIAAAMYVTRQDESPKAPQEFVDPSFSSIASETTSTTTTETITSTAPQSTTEINGPPSPSTTSDTSGSSTTTSSGESPPPATIHTREPEVSPGAPTSRRPRFNVTRTLPPQQVG
jgi:cytoskeletal protein RodZ